MRRMACLPVVEGAARTSHPFFFSESNLRSSGRKNNEQLENMVAVVPEKAIETDG